MSVVLDKTAYTKGPGHQFQTVDVLVCLLQGTTPTGGHVLREYALTPKAGVRLQDEVCSGTEDGSVIPSFHVVKPPMVLGVDFEIHRDILIVRVVGTQVPSLEALHSPQVEGAQENSLDGGRQKAHNPGQGTQWDKVCLEDFPELIFDVGDVGGREIKDCTKSISNPKN